MPARVEEFRAPAAGHRRTAAPAGVTRRRWRRWRPASPDMRAIQCPPRPGGLAVTAIAA